MSDEVTFLRELVLRQATQIENLTSEVVKLKTASTFIPEDREIVPATPLPEEVVKAVAGVAEPNSTLGRQLQQRAFVLLHGGEKPEDVAQRMMEGIRPDV